MHLHEILLNSYWFFEVLWFIFYAGAAFAIEAATEGPEGLSYQVCIGLNAFHMTMLAVVLYAKDVKASKWIFLGFFGVLVTDIAVMMHSFLHLRFEFDPYFWAFVLTSSVSTFGAFNTCVAIVWHAVRYCSKIRGDDYMTKYQSL